MKPMISLTAVLLMSSTMAFAAVTAESIATDLQAQGYTNIEIKQSATQIKAEAMRGSEKFEAVYDAASGDVLKQSTETGATDEAVDNSDDASNDDHSGASGDDDSSDHDAGDDNGGGSDDSGSDDGDHGGGSDDGDHDSGSDDGDHGGDHNSGSDGGSSGGDDGHDAD